MHKPTISSVIALTLLGCGGGESGNSGNTTPPVKYFNVSFLDLDNIAINTQTNCQIFGYNEDQTKKIVAYRSAPENNYQIVVHDEHGNFVRRYSNSTETNGLSSTFRFRQSDVPQNGYVSFVYSEGRDNFVSTYSKDFITESFSIYAKNKNNNSNCLSIGSGNNSNPQTSDYKSFIHIPDENKLFFFSLNHFNQLSFEPTNKLGRDVSVNSRRGRPLLLTAYERTNQDVIQNLFSFKFRATNALGSLGQEIDLDIIDQRDTPWTVPSDVELSSAQLFVDGKQFNAPYAYLWQSLNTSSEDKYSYSNLINVDNYYLKLKGKEISPPSSPYWKFQHVSRGTSSITSHLSAENILDGFPNPEPPTLGICNDHNNTQCIKITHTQKTDNTILRLLIDSELTVPSGLPIFIKQTIYSPYHNELPVMKFDSPILDQELKEIKDFSVSWIKTPSSSITETFLYQYQDLYKRTLGSELIDPSIDNIPLLKNISAQQDQQDLLKRQPYTWVWLEE
ncbi:hypothetical protein [Vibrio cholerae]|uniref:hypothetical protein n=1 Tax=Vibrio cholerae TaxID=666 RepID=UPI0035316554